MHRLQILIVAVFVLLDMLLALRTGKDPSNSETKIRDYVRKGLAGERLCKE